MSTRTPNLLFLRINSKEPCTADNVWSFSLSGIIGLFTMLMHGFQLCQFCNVSSECFHNIPLVVRSRERFILKGKKEIIISAPESQVKKENLESVNAILSAQTPNHLGFCLAPFIYHFNYRRDLLLQRAVLCLFSKERKGNLRQFNL